MWLNICAFPHILASPSSFMTLQPIPPKFPYIRGKFCFFQFVGPVLGLILRRSLWGTLRSATAMMM